MSYQAYLDSIREKTGLSPEHFHALAEKQGLLRPGVKAGQVVGWLKSDYGLGHGHAMAMYGTIRSFEAPKVSDEDRVDKHFSGKRSQWRPTYNKIVTRIKKFGSDVDVRVGNSYLSLMRKGKKFAIVQVSAERLDIGLKLKGTKAQGRFTAAGTWNSMVTHRVSITDPSQLDRQVIDGLQDAYSRA
jgi:hypothetical protein